MNIQVQMIREVREEVQQSEIDYYPLEFNEDKFDKLLNREEYYLNIYRLVYEMKDKKQLKLYDYYPKQKIYEPGMCFLFKRPNDSALKSIIYGMNGSISRDHKEGLVQEEGSISYLDGKLKSQKNLIIRVVKLKKQSQRDQYKKYHLYKDLILIHFFEKGLQRKITKPKKYYNSDDSYDIYMNTSKKRLCNQEESGSEEHIQQESQKMSKNQNPSKIKIEATQPAFKSINQGCLQKINQTNEQNKQIMQHTSTSQNQLNIFRKKEEEEKQNFSGGVQSQQNMGLLNLDLKSQIPKNEVDLNSKNEPQQISQNENQYQKVIQQLTLENNELQQQLLKQCIEQKKKELQELEQNLQKLQKQENLIKMPQNFNTNNINNLFQNIKINN